MQGPPSLGPPNLYLGTTGVGAGEAHVKCALSRPIEPQERKNPKAGSLILGIIKSTSVICLEKEGQEKCSRICAGTEGLPGRQVAGAAHQDWTRTSER